MIYVSLYKLNETYIIKYDTGIHDAKFNDILVLYI